MKTVAEVLTLPNVLAWAETKDQNEEFNYCDGARCALAQYLTAQGFEDVGVTAVEVVRPDQVTIPVDLVKAVDALLAHSGIVYTFGQLVKVLTDYKP